ncbi:MULTISPECIES: 5'-nucleotidase [Neisseria]
MSYDLSKRLVIGLASSALFDLSESDNIFRTEGAETYRQYQREKQNHPPKKRCLSIYQKLCQSMK